MKKSSTLNTSMSTWVFTALYGCLFIGIFYSSYTWMISHDWSKDDYTYCYLIPFIVLYLIWEKKKEFSGFPSLPSWRGLFFLVPGIALFWLGELGGEFYTIYISSWLVLVGLCWLHMGWRKLKVIGFPLFFILTMFPPPNFIYNKISVQLKLISSELGVAMMQVYGLSAYREGNIIDLGFTQLQVVDACSGLRYLIPLIVMGLLLAYFYRAPFWKKFILVLSTVPLSILTNSLRIASVGILYEYWGPVVADGFFHDFSGWFIFMVSFVLLVLEMGILKLIPQSQSSKLKAHRGEAEKSMSNNQGYRYKPRMTGKDSHGSMLNTERKRLRHSQATGFAKFVVAFILLGSTLALAQGVEFREKIPINKSFAEFPLQVGNWSGTRQTMEQKFIDTLDLSEYVIVDYKDKQGLPVNFYVAYYESQRKGESIHSPATCLPGSGWLFNEAGGVTLPIATSNGTPVQVNRAFMQKGNYRQLSYYWFPQRGRILTNAYQLKLFAFWDALTRQRTDGALVRVITPVGQYEKLEEAEKRLQGFVGEMVPVLEEFIPN